MQIVHVVSTTRHTLLTSSENVRTEQSKPSGPYTTPFPPTVTPLAWCKMHRFITRPVNIWIIKRKFHQRNSPNSSLLTELQGMLINFSQVNTKGFSTVACDVEPHSLSNCNDGLALQSAPWAWRRSSHRWALLSPRFMALGSPWCWQFSTPGVTVGSC